MNFDKFGFLKKLPISINREGCVSCKSSDLVKTRKVWEQIMRIKND